MFLILFSLLALTILTIFKKILKQQKYTIDLSKFYVKMKTENTKITSSSIYIYI